MRIHAYLTEAYPCYKEIKIPQAWPCILLFSNLGLIDMAVPWGLLITEIEVHDDMNGASK